MTAADKTEVVTNRDHLARLKFSPTLPLAFTEHGPLMLGNVLKSPQAVQVSLLVVRAFVRMRALLATNEKLAEKLDELESGVARHDAALAHVIETIRQLTQVPRHTGRTIGFTVDISKESDD